MPKAKTVKMADLGVYIVSEIFRTINSDKVSTMIDTQGLVIITDTEPSKLIYPEGWYYHAGYFCNAGNSSCGIDEKVRMINRNAESWAIHADYCTLDD